MPFPFFFCINMGPKLRLTYLKNASVAELTRLSLHYGGVPFEDVRVNYDDLELLKLALPLGNVPILEVDDVVYSQSMAIARYAAKISGHFPDDPLDVLHADMISETLLEFKNAINCVRYDETKESLNEDMLKPLLEVTLPKVFNALEIRVRGAFFLGNKASYADVHLFNLVENELKWTFGDIDLSAFPKLLAIVERVRTNSGVAAYIANRGDVESFRSFRFMGCLLSSQVVHNGRSSKSFCSLVHRVCNSHKHIVCPQRRPSHCHLTLRLSFVLAMFMLSFQYALRVLHLLFEP